jgi:DNA-binding transcriptional LysR family regulator
MQVDQLRHLVALAEENNFGRASRAVHITQPALTKSIQRLEEQFGVRIFDRLPRGVHPTPQGQLIIDWARSVLASKKLLKRDLDHIAGLSKGTLTIGAGPYIADAVIGPFVGAFIEQYPGMEVKIMNRPWNELEGMLLAQTVDLSIGYMFELDYPEEIEVLIQRGESIVWYCRPGHPLLSMGAVSREQIASYPMVVPSVPRGIEEIFMDHFGISTREEGKNRFPFAVQCDDLETLRKVVLSSDCIGPLADSALRADFDRGYLARLPFSIEGLTVPIGLACLKRTTLSPSAAAFVEIFREALEEMGESG